MNREQFWLTEEQFSKIAPHLPTDTRGSAARRLRRPKAIGRLKTAEMRSFHEADGAPRPTATNAIRSIGG